MEARIARIVLLAASVTSLGASYRTANFIVSAPSPQVAEQVGLAAEKYRRELAIEWLGKPLDKWQQPCPIAVDVGPGKGAGGATSFVFDRGQVFGWQMSIQGSLERVLDSVLPHEVTHTVFATHFRQPLPRWADEGGCSTVEHASERIKQQKMLVRYLQSGRGIPFSQMFAMREYPPDILPLYAQGHSLATFLIGQGGKRKFMAFVADGLEQERWSDIVSAHYGFSSLGSLQNAWVDWVRMGSPLPIQPALAAKTAPASAAKPAADTLAANQRRKRPEPNLIHRAAKGDLANQLVPVNRPDDSAAEGPVVNQVTRPQPVEQARQVILEWQHQGPGPAAASRSAEPRRPDDTSRSVYDLRREERGLLRR
ncbi:MAG: hypothetical protein WD278_18795 [Pirellulales bacterium]